MNSAGHRRVRDIHSAPISDPEGTARCIIQFVSELFSAVRSRLNDRCEVLLLKFHSKLSSSFQYPLMPDSGPMTKNTVRCFRATFFAFCITAYVLLSLLDALGVLVMASYRGHVRVDSLGFFGEPTLRNVLQRTPMLSIPCLLRTGEIVMNHPCSMSSCLQSFREISCGCITDYSDSASYSR